MLSHVTVGVARIDRALGFYDALAVELGLVAKFAEPHWAGWMQPGGGRPLLIITRPFDGRPASAGNGQMIALLAPSRAAVDRCYEAALRSGGAGEGPPGLRPQYHADFYGAYFRDPDGNKLCVCCHEPGPG